MPPLMTLTCLVEGFYDFPRSFLRRAIGAPRSEILSETVRDQDLPGDAARDFLISHEARCASPSRVRRHGDGSPGRLCRRIQRNRGDRRQLDYPGTILTGRTVWTGTYPGSTTPDRGSSLLEAFAAASVRSRIRNSAVLAAAGPRT